MLPVLVRCVQAYSYCVAPPALPLGSVLPIYGPLTAVRAGVTRMPYGQSGRCSYVAGLVDGTFLPRPPFTLLFGVAATITDAGWIQGSYLPAC